MVTSVDDFINKNIFLVNGIAIFEIVLVYIILSIIIVFGYDAALFF
jgi:hypothetical protein